MGERNKRTKLKKSMGPGSIWAVAVGSIIGWGCFIQGGLWTERAGGPLPLFLGFLAGGLLMIVVGYSYSYMIAKFPVAGGEFAYAYKGFGRTASYICGWMLSLGYLSIVALNATALPVLASYIFPYPTRKASWQGVQACLRGHPELSGVPGSYSCQRYIPGSGSDLGNLCNSGI